MPHVEQQRECVSSHCLPPACSLGVIGFPGGQQPSCHTPTFGTALTVQGSPLGLVMHITTG